MSFKNFFWHLDNDYVYLDNAATTPPLKTVMQAVEDFMRTYGSIHRGSGRFSEISTNRYEEARATISHFINAKQGRDVVIFTGNTTDGINRVALLFPWRPGDAVLVSDIEHSSNLLPWLKVAEVVTFATTDKYQITAEAIEKELKLHPNIKIVAIAGASNLTGQIIDMKKIYDVCKKYGSLLFIDASQLAPHFPIDLDYCDLVAFSGHKMYAPFGAGVLAGRKEILSYTGLAPTGGGNVCFIHPKKGPVYKDTPWRHEAGTPNGAGAIAIAAAAKTLMNIGFDTIKAHNAAITDWILKHIGSIEGVKLHFPIAELVEKGVPHTPIAVFEVEGIPARTVAEQLYKENIAIRYGTFCLYRLLERVKNIPQDVVQEIYEKQTPSNCDLTDKYHLIRASGGLMTIEEDFVKLGTALRKIISKR